MTTPIHPIHCRCKRCDPHRRRDLALIWAEAILICLAVIWSIAGAVNWLLT